MRGRGISDWSVVRGPLSVVRAQVRDWSVVRGPLSVAKAQASYEFGWHHGEALIQVCG